MRQHPKSARIAGLVLHVLIGALLIFAGAFKLFGTPPTDAVENLQKMNLLDKMALLGVGEMITGLLLIIPKTMSLGTLLTSGFWGGVICVHMTQNERYIPWAIPLLLTWLGAYLRNPATFASFHPTSVEIRPEFSPTMPYSSPSLTRQERSRSRV